jgi:hypothetical protein
MSLHRTDLKLATALSTVLSMALLASPAAGAEEEAVVPSGNSAVNQYTETFPTSRGGKDVQGKGGGKAERQPQEVLGSRNARRLEQHGSDGEAVAELTAETAPPTGGAGGGSSAAGGSGGGQDAGSPPASKGASSGVSNGGGRGMPASGDAGSSDGSSGVGEVVGHATGASSSGEIGPLLPLAIVAIALWALFYATRPRRRRVS